MPSKLTAEQLGQLIGVLDDALQSDAPAVVSALQNLILLTGLSGEKSNSPGPLQQLFDRLDRLEREMRHMNDLIRVREMEKQYRNDYYKYNYNNATTGYTPSWVIYDEFNSKPTNQKLK